MSSRTDGVAVAVSASTLAFPSFSITLPSAK